MLFYNKVILNFFLQFFLNLNIIFHIFSYIFYKLYLPHSKKISNKLLSRLNSIFMIIFIELKKALVFTISEDNSNISSINKLTESVVKGDQILRSGLSLSERKAAIKIASSNLDKIKSLKNSSDDTTVTDKLIKDFILDLEKNLLDKDFNPVINLEDTTFFFFICFIIVFYIFIYFIYFIYCIYNFFFKKK